MIKTFIGLHVTQKLIGLHVIEKPVSILPPTGIARVDSNPGDKKRQMTAWPRYSTVITCGCK